MIVNQAKWINKQGIEPCLFLYHTIGFTYLPFNSNEPFRSQASSLRSSRYKIQ